MDNSKKDPKGDHLESFVTAERLDAVHEKLFADPDPEALTLSDDEKRRYWRNEMDDQEKAEIEAYADSVPEARKELNAARTRYFVEPSVTGVPQAGIPRDADLAPIERSWRQFALRIVIGFGFAAAIAAVTYNLGTRQGISAGTVELQALREKSESLQNQLGEKEKNLTQLSLQKRLWEAERSVALAKGKEADRLQEEVTLLRQKLEQQRRLIASNQGTSSNRPRSWAEGDPLGAYNENPVQMGESSSGAPQLISPAPGNPALTQAPRTFTVQLPNGGDYEGAIWPYAGAELGHALPSTTSAVGNRLSITSPSPLKPGRYAVGIRKLEPDSTVPDSERSWHVYSIKVLSAKELADRSAALQLSDQAPSTAAGILFRLECYADAERVLAKLPQSSRTNKAKVGLQRWIDAAKAGQAVQISSELRGDLGEQEVYASLDEGPQATQGDSMEALQRMFQEGLGLSGEKKYHEAIAKFRAAIPMAERIGNDYGVARIEYEILEIQSTCLFDSVAAEKTASSLLPRLRKLYEVRQGHRNELTIRVMASGAPRYAAIAYRWLKRYPEAIAAAEESVRIGKAEGMINLVPWSLFEIGVIYQDQEKYPEAIRRYEAVLEYLKTVPENTPAMPVSWVDHYSSSLGNIAFCHIKQGNYTKALEFSDRALIRRKDASPQVVAPILLLRANAKIELGEDREVLEDIEAARAIYRRYPDAIAEARLAVTLGNYFLRKGLVVEAKASVENAKKILTRSSDQDLRPGVEREINALNQALATLIADPNGLLSAPANETEEEKLARLLAQSSISLRNKEWGAAEKTAAEAVEIARRRTQDFQISLALNNVAWAKANGGDLQGAIERFEEGNAAFRRAMKNQAQRGRPGVIQQRSAHTGLYVRYAWALWKQGRTDEAVAVLDSTRGLGLSGDAGKDWQSLVAPLRQASKGSPGTLILQYSLIDSERTLLLASLGGESRGFELAFGTSDLAKELKDWSPDIRPTADRSPGAERKVARIVGAHLFDAIEGAKLLDPRTVKRIVVIADPAIQQVPFAALIDRSGKRLIERFPVSYAVSLSSMGASKQASGATKPLYAVGFRGLPPFSADAQDAEQAAQDIARLVPGAMPRIGEQAKEATVKREMKEYRILLFSTHSVYDPTDAMNSYIEIRKDGKEDGRLHAKEVHNLALKADLAVLSGCETGGKGMAGGDGLLGMAWAFRAAGCASVVATNWKVSSDASRVLVTDLFRDLVKGRDKDASLRAAALKTMRSPSRSHPYYWAGYRLIGGFGPTKF